MKVLDNNSGVFGTHQFFVDIPCPTINDASFDEITSVSLTPFYTGANADVQLNAAGSVITAVAKVDG